MVSIRERDQIVFGHPIDWASRREGIKKFRGLTWEQYLTLRERGYKVLGAGMSPETFRHLRDFLQKYGGTAFGWVPGPTRRHKMNVLIRGLEYEGEVTLPMLLDFVNWFHTASEVNASEDYLYARFD